MAKGKKTKWEQLHDGEWRQPVKRGFLDQCCDCGLVHRMEFRIKDGDKIEFRAFRDEKKTAAARRAFKFTPDEE
jgi:hypothetical protein